MDGCQPSSANHVRFSRSKPEMIRDPWVMGYGSNGSATTLDGSLVSRVTCLWPIVWPIDDINRPMGHHKILNIVLKRSKILSVRSWSVHVMHHSVIQERCAIAERTVRCRNSFRYVGVSNFTTASYVRAVYLPEHGFLGVFVSRLQWLIMWKSDKY